MNTLVVLFLLAASPAPARGDAKRGQPLYQRYCAACHGAKGAADGPSAAWLEPHPRDFTHGSYRCRSTPSESLPTDQDLFDTIGRGLAHSRMAGWPALSERARWDLVAFLKTLSPRFATEQPAAAVVIPPMPARTPERVAAGRVVWDKMQCASCHGMAGHGDGMAAATSYDDWGWPARPQALTKPGLRCGEGPGTIVRDVLTGLTGTPMPSYAGALSGDEAWELAFYVWTFSHPEEHGAPAAGKAEAHQAVTPAASAAP